MKKLNENFIIKGSGSALHVFPKLGEVNLKKASEEVLIEVFEGGFNVLGITAVGAKKIYGPKNSDDVIAVVAKCVDVDDVIAIGNAKDTKKVTSAVEARIKQLA